MILSEIVAHKKKEVALRKRDFPLPDHPGDGGRAPGDFRAAVSRPGLNVIAEIKKASPSRGVIRGDFDPLRIAKSYEENGASAISVLTDEKFFQGGLSVMEDVVNAVSLPVLRKDFIIDPYQIHEAARYGASAVLLIAAILDGKTLKAFIRLAGSLGLAALVEVHTGAELKKALRCGPEIIGINNRDLNTFRTDINVTCKLLERIPGDEYIIVSESGIKGPDDARRLKGAGVNAILVGETLMAAEDPGLKLKEFRV